MSQYIVYINEELIDLYPDTKIAINVKNGDVGDIAQRKVSQTKDFSVPPTENNRTIFENCDLVGSETTVPYAFSDAKVIIAGIELPLGKAIITETERDYKLTVYLDFFDFVKSLGVSTLRDLSFPVTTITWNSAYIFSRRNATDFVVTPFINYGQLGTDGNLQPTAVAFSIGAVYPPSVYYHSIMSAIFDSQNLTAEGEIFSDEYYNSVILPYGYDGAFPSSFTINQILPDIKQTDMLKDFCIRFAVYMTIQGNTLYCKNINELLNNKQDALDLTTLRAANFRDRMVYTVDLGQINQFNYPNDVQGQGSSTFEIDNVQLETEKEIYESIFDASAQQTTTIGADSINDAYIPYWNQSTPPATYDFDETPTPRIALVRERDTPEPAVDYGTPQTDYLVGTFLASGGSLHSSQWSYLLDRYYGSYIDSVQKLKVIERVYNLSIIDIVQLMQTNIIFDTDAYFLVLEVPDFVDRTLTKLKLMRVY